MHKHIAWICVIVMMTFTSVAFAKTTSSMLLRTAKQYTGYNEHRNNRQLKRLIGVNPARTKWCGLFMAAVARKSGYRLPANAGMAKSWVRFGARSSHPQAGDVVVVRTRRGHHVGLLLRINSNKVWLIGGNQSNAVKESQFSLRSVIAIRRP